MKMRLERHPVSAWREFVWSVQKFRRLDGRPVHLFELTAAPPLIRTPRMNRWHRPRRGYFHSSVGRSFDTWCHYALTDLRGRRSGRGPQLIFADHLSGDTDLPVCGTCEGRAVGAGHAPTAVVLMGELIYESWGNCQRSEQVVNNIHDKRGSAAA